LYRQAEKFLGEQETSLPQDLMNLKARSILLKVNSYFSGDLLAEQDMAAVLLVEEFI
jgi:hypothetical protein